MNDTKLYKIRKSKFLAYLILVLNNIGGTVRIEIRILKFVIQAPVSRLYQT